MKEVWLLVSVRESKEINAKIGTLVRALGKVG